MSKENKTFDVEKYTNMADELANNITSTIATSGPLSTTEELLVMTLAVGQVLQAKSNQIGADPKALTMDFCAALTSFIDTGGDRIMTELLNMMKRNTN